MRLPGGPVDGPGGPGPVRLTAPTGRLERLLDAVDEPGAVPQRVTAVLAAAVQLGDAPAGATWCRSLSVGDRRFLLRRVLVALGRGTGWRTVRCGACEEPFDVMVDHSALVPPPVPPGWPRRTVPTGAGVLTVRAATGADEEAVAGRDPADAAGALLGACADVDPASLGPADRAAVEAALAELGPDPVLSVGTSCAACGAPAELDVDPYGLVGAGDGALLREVHELAAAYHWGEGDILDLPVTRRRAYLALVAAGRGVAR